MKKQSNLSDLSVLIFVRPDTIERLVNVIAVSRYLVSETNACVYVFECAFSCNGFLKRSLDERVQYSFVRSYNPIDDSSFYFDREFRKIKTPLVALWTADIIIPVCQIEKAAEILREGNAGLVCPFREPTVDSVSVIRQMAQNILPENKKDGISELLFSTIPGLSDGVYIVRRNSYLRVSGREEYRYYGEERNELYNHWKERGLIMKDIPGTLARLHYGTNVKLGKLILHFNTPEMTDRLCRMVPGAIVIDNGSTRYPYKGKNRCIRQDNLGFTRGWNQAIRTLWNEFDAFWLMNSDIVIDPESAGRVEWIVSARPDILFFSPSYNCWMRHCMPHRKGGLALTGMLEFTAPVIRKQVFEKVGFFDESFALGYGVDFDFCYRARRAGIKIYVDYSSCFYHLSHQTIQKHGGIEKYDRDALAEMKRELSHKYGSGYEDLVFNGINEG